MKHHLANMCRTMLKKAPIQETFELNEYLPAFVGRYLELEASHSDNSWILKPTNMARSMDTWVTTSLSQILRLTETGPKIA